MDDIKHRLLVEAVAESDEPLDLVDLANVASCGFDTDTFRKDVQSLQNEKEA